MSIASLNFRATSNLYFPNGISLKIDNILQIPSELKPFECALYSFEDLVKMYYKEELPKLKDKYIDLKNIM